MGVRWWGQASEGSEQRRMLYFSGYRVLFWLQREKQGEEPSPDPLLGSTQAPSWGAAKVWLAMETGSALQGPPSLRGLKETPKGSGWV